MNSLAMTTLGDATATAALLAADVAQRVPAWLQSPLTWSIALGAAALLCLLPRSGRRARQIGVGLGLVALACLIASSQAVGELGARANFWILASLALGSSASAICSRSAVYSAVWFAVSLIGVAGLFLSQNAQFLGVATIVVYAGAIVVTFLFVVMLAQPQGHDTYDRLSWGPLAKPAVVGTAILLLGAVLFVLQELRTAAPPVASLTQQGPDTDAHMAALGNQLFGRHLVSIEVAGTLLLAALVAAIAIVSHGRDTLKDAEAKSDGSAVGAKSSREGGSS